VNKVNQPVRQISGKIRAEITAAVLHNAPGHVNARIFFVCQPDVWECLVIAQQDVKARLVLLDEIVFKRQSFFVVVDLYKIDVARFGNQASGLCFRQPVVIKITAHAAAKVLRLADIEDTPLCIFVEVNARPGGKLRNFLAKFHFLIGSYNPIVTRKLLFSCWLIILQAVSPAFAAQTHPTQQQKPQTPQTQAQPPDETNPPEEDSSVAPRTYAFDPLEAQRCISIGNFYMHKGSKGYRAALGRYEDATKYDPNSAEAFFKVGEVEEKLNNKDAARIAFERVIKLAPDSKFAKEARKKLAGLG